MEVSNFAIRKWTLSEESAVKLGREGGGHGGEQLGPVWTLSTFMCEEEPVFSKHLHFNVFAVTPVPRQVPDSRATLLTQPERIRGAGEQ